MNGRVRALIISATLFLPLIIYVFLRGCSTPVFNTLPKIADTVWSADKKQVISFSYKQVPDFQLIDQNGKPFTQDSMKNAVWLVNFISPNRAVDTMMRNVLIGNLQQEYYENAENINIVKVLSISTYPTEDTPEKLMTYLRSKKIDPTKWKFATGTDAEVLKIMRALHLPQIDSSMTQLPASFFSPNIYFLDMERFVRGEYIGTQLGKTGLHTLKEDLRALLFMEYKDKIKKPN